MIRKSGTESQIIYYLETPPSREPLIKVIADMWVSVRSLLRENIEPYQQLGLVENRLTDDQWLDFMLSYPILINRRIVVTPLGTRSCRPSEKVLDILPAQQQGAFAKEQGEQVIDTAGSTDSIIRVTPES